MSTVQTNVNLPIASRQLLERISERKDWGFAVVVRRGLDALASTDPDLADLRPVSVQAPVHFTPEKPVAIPVNVRGTASVTDATPAQAPASAGS